MISIVLENEPKKIKTPEEGKIYAVKLEQIRGIVPNNDKDSYTTLECKDIVDFSKKSIGDRYTLIKYIGQDKFIELYSNRILPYIYENANMNELQRQYEVLPLANKEWVQLELSKKIENQPLAITNYTEIDTELVKSVLEVNNGSESDILDYMTTASRNISALFSNIINVVQNTKLRDELYKKALCDFEVAIEKYKSLNNSNSNDVNKNKVQVKLV